MNYAKFIILAAVIALLSGCGTTPTWSHDSLGNEWTGSVYGKTYGRFGGWNR